jgi:two-component system LytT family response regulator
MTGRIFRAVVADDEPAARDVVTTFLSEIPEIEVAGVATNGVEATEMVRSLSPDLLFLDVRMPDRDGFEVLEALGDHVPAGVVLVTAHGEFAQRAFDVHAVDYVPTPFGRPRCLAAVERALLRLRAEDALDVRRTLDSLMQSLRLDQRANDNDAGIADGPELTESGAAGAADGTQASAGPASGIGTDNRRIGIRLGTRTTLVDVQDVDWVEADGDLVRLHVGEKIHLLQSRMRDLEARLGEEWFVRIHRSVIVNLDRVRVLHRDADGGGSVALTSGVQLRVARTRWETLEERLGLRDRG